MTSYEDKVHTPRRDFQCLYVECHYIVDGNMCQHIVNKVL